jgi:hypothetical protein
MENKENLVTEEIVTEEAAQTATDTQAEQIAKPVKTYTEEEVNAIVGKRVARNEAKIRKQYDKKYGELEEVLKAGTGKQNVPEMTETFKKFYQSKGIQMPEKPQYNAADLETLAKADANEFISGGYEDVCEEVDRLTELGAANMTAREKAMFKVLAEHRQNAERSNELAKLGVTEDVYNSKEFGDFQRMFNPGTPIADIYNLYTKTQPKKEVRTMGSMKGGTAKEGGVKDFYTVEEARKFTKADFDKNPELFKAVEKSMAKWR